MKIIGIVGWKNCGKTTLATAVINELSSRGFNVSSVKHAHHFVDVDQKGTDSYRHREAGANEVILASGQRYAIMRELRGAPEPDLDELLTRLSPCDWVVVEGMKGHRHPKIEVHLQTCDQTPLFHQDSDIIAVATDHKLDFDGPEFDINDVKSMVDFILVQEAHEALT